MKTGKVEWKIMESLLSLLPTEDIDVIVGPAIGEDAAVIRVRDGFLVVHSNPITTGVRKAGYLAVHVAANDVAVRGVRPRWFLPVVLIPPTYSEENVKEIFNDMTQALAEIGGIVVGGHTEVTPGFQRPIISMTAIGYTTSRVILTRDAKVGDIAYIVGRVAGEGTGIIAWDYENTLLDKGVSKSVIEKAKSFVYDISVVKTALRIKDYVNSMHDATEGGVLQALREVAVASNVGILIDENEILSMLEYEVSTITSAVNVNPLKLLSSGCIVATVPPHLKREFEEAVEETRRPYRSVGVVIEGKGQLILRTKSGDVLINRDIVDEIYKLW